MRVALILLASLLATAEARGERMFGLVIGIDDYTYIPDLHGAVNDARDIADALSGLGADVTLLTDADATRKAILGEWERILGIAAPGDRLFVSYAGHGSNEPEHTPGNERDGRDENFLLAGFAPHGQAAGERIRDDEIADLLFRSAALEVIFVADACHAGTVTRDLKPTLGYRYVDSESISSDPLPPPPPPPPGQGEGLEQIALFLAAVNETEKVPEVLIDGTPRGALSYAFAKGLRGAADFDGNRILSKGEIETFVRRSVRQVTDGAQLPQSEPAGQENRSLIVLEADSPPAKTPVPLTARRFADLPLVRVGPEADWSGIEGVRAGAHGDLRHDGQAVYSAVGDRLAFVADTRTLQAVVDKQRLVAALNVVASSRVEIGFDQGDRLYLDGEQMEVRIAGRTVRHLALFNIGADGTISFLYPLSDLGDPPAEDPARVIGLSVAVTAPFGADHVVAIETVGPAPVLVDGLGRLSGSRDLAALWELVRNSRGLIALFPFFTAERPL